MVIVNLCMSSQVAYNRKVAAATFNRALEGFLQLSLGDCIHFVNFGVNFITSPVWLYMCVVSELGRVNFLKHTLHLYRFGVVEETFVLNVAIMFCNVLLSDVGEEDRDVAPDERRL